MTMDDQTSKRVPKPTDKACAALVERFGAARKCKNNEPRTQRNPSEQLSQDDDDSPSTMDHSHETEDTIEPSAKRAHHACQPTNVEALDSSDTIVTPNDQLSVSKV